MQYRDYYKILDVAKDASKQDIQTAYRKLARKYHPDVNQEAGAEDRFKEISESYEVLKDKEKRRKYDQYGSAWQSTQQTGAPPPGWEGFNFDFGSATAGGPRGAGVSGGGFDFGDSGFSSFFEMLFGGAQPQTGFRGGFGGRPSRVHKGSDLEVDLQLTLEEAAHGGEREIALTDPQTRERKTLKVTLPKGVRGGQKIRLVGQGTPGGGGAASGDLFMKVDIAPHSRFRLDGRNLHTTLPVAPWEAALGAEVPIRTLDGELRLKIPAGSSSGRKIRLRGKGFPSPKAAAGDLYAELRVVLPDELTDQERELFEQLAETSEFKAEGGGRGN